MLRYLDSFDYIEKERNGNPGVSFVKIGGKKRACGEGVTEKKGMRRTQGRSSSLEELSEWLRFG